MRQLNRLKRFSCIHSTLQTKQYTFGASCLFSYHFGGSLDVNPSNPPPSRLARCLQRSDTTNTKNKDHVGAFIENILQKIPSNNTNETSKNKKKRKITEQP